MRRDRPVDAAPAAQQTAIGNGHNAALGVKDRGTRMTRLQRRCDPHDLGLGARIGLGLEELAQVLALKSRPKRCDPFQAPGKLDAQVDHLGSDMRIAPGIEYIPRVGHQALKRHRLQAQVVVNAQQCQVGLEMGAGHLGGQGFAFRNLAVNQNFVASGNGVQRGNHKARLGPHEPGRLHLAVRQRASDLHHAAGADLIGGLGVRRARKCQCRNGGSQFRACHSPPSRWIWHSTTCAAVVAATQSSGGSASIFCATVASIWGDDGRL